MGRYLLIVNLDKRQYLDPHGLGESAKSSNYLKGTTANAVALLVCKPTDALHSHGELAGHWFGDRLVAAGDDDCPPNQDGLITATPDDPSRNLYQMARAEFRDMSFDAMLMLCRGSWHWAEDFVRLAKKEDTQLFIRLATVALHENCTELLDALAGVNGPNWVEKYRRACEKYGIEPSADSA